MQIGAVHAGVQGAIDVSGGLMVTLPASLLADMEGRAIEVRYGANRDGVTGFLDFTISKGLFERPGTWLGIAALVVGLGGGILIGRRR